MRRSLLAISVVLSTGGWVCDSESACPHGALTCPSDVAAVCCPAGSPYRCGDQCSPTPLCADFSVCTYPDDPGSGLCSASAYVATVDDITCAVVAQQGGALYEITTRGTLTGCGLTKVSIRQAPEYLAISSADCGRWSSDILPMGLGCVPGSRTPGAPASDWQIQSTFEVATPDSLAQVGVTITVDLGEEPVIAQATQACPPLPTQ